MNKPDGPRAPLSAAQFSTWEDGVGRYEELREAVLGQKVGNGGGLGFALFLRQGMAAWLQAWSNCTLSPVRLPLSTQGCPQEAVSGEQRDEVVLVLAAMALSHLQEAV